MKRSTDTPPPLSASRKRDLVLQAKQGQDYVDPARRRRQIKTQPRLSQSESPPRLTRAIRRLRPTTAQLAVTGPALPSPTIPEAVLSDGGSTTTIPRHARLGIMFMALQEGVTPIAKRFEIPESTLYTWFREEGGIQEIREYVAETASVALQRLVQVTCDELQSRMLDAPTPELFETFRKMLEVGETSGLVRRRRGGSGSGSGSESGERPSPTPGIVLQFNTPASLPTPGDTKSDPSQVIQGEVTDVTDVFDE